MKIDVEKALTDLANEEEDTDGPDPDAMVEFVEGLNESLESEALEDLAGDIADIGKNVTVATDTLEKIDERLERLIDLVGEDEEEAEEPG